MLEDFYFDYFVVFLIHFSSTWAKFDYCYCQALIHFIYWDAIPDMEEISSLSTKCASTLMAQHLLAAADRYALDRLKLLCEAKLCEDIAINTVATTLALAEQHHCFELKSVCLKFVALPENLRGIIRFLLDFSFNKCILECRSTTFRRISQGAYEIVPFVT